MKTSFLSKKGMMLFPILFCFLIGYNTSLFAQSNEDVELKCSAEFSQSTNWCDEEFSKSVDQNYLDSFEPVVFNIFFWRIVQDNGNPGIDHINEQDVLKAIANINIIFNEYDIFFK